MADTSVKLSGTYDSIEAYNILTEMQTLGTTIEEYKDDAEAAATTASSAVSTAQGYANAANGYANNASTYAGNASDSADEAAEYAANASTSATNAASSATDASNSAAAASTSETNAAASATNAAASEAVVNGALPLSGGTMTGDITLADGGKALSSAVVGKVVTKSISSSVSLSASTAKTITSISLSAGTWVVNGHVSYTSVTANKIYGAAITTTANNYGYANEGAIALHSALNGTIVPNVTCVLTLASTTTVYLCGYATASATAANAHLTAVRIV